MKSSVTAELMNQYADFWFYDIGVNLIPANTKDKNTFESWTEWQNKSIPDKVHESRKKNGYYNNGIAIMPGPIWRGHYMDKCLVGIDLDNKKAIDEFVGSGLEDLKQQTLVEQHADPNKMHIYFIVEREIPNKTSDKVDISKAEKIKANDIPALEVKSNSKGIMFCSTSPHADGSNYQIIGTLKPQVFKAKDVEDRVKGICDKYEIPYGSDNNNNKNNSNLSYQIPIEDLWKPETKILAGHNRHLGLLRVMDSLLARNREILSFEKIKKLAYVWNQDSCDPPLDDKEFEKVWKQSAIFVAKGIDSKSNNDRHYDGNDHWSSNTNIQQQSKPILLPIGNKNYFEYIIKSIKKTVKCEDALIRQIVYTGFSTYIEDDPINLGILAPTSEGKTYAITESLQYFPDSDIMYIGQMSPKVLVRQKGILIDKKSGEPLYDKVEELRTKSRELKKKKRAVKDRDEIAEINEEIERIDEDIRRLYENSKTLIDLRGKILVFLESPQPGLWDLLKPILSHDKKEIEFPFVDKTSNSNAVTKDVVVRGWPACIFCSAKDESKWEIWNEIKSRILVTSPNMIQKKYQESIKLLLQSKGLPNLIQQQIIISDEEIETTQNCILAIKQKINGLKFKDKKVKISLWIPYIDLLQKELPANKGTDVRYAKKVLSLLNIVPIVNSDLRLILVIEGESSIIADLQDLKEVLAITQNFDGLPKFKIEFFNDIFLPLFKTKTEPDVRKNDKGETVKEEERRGVTTRELCDYSKEKRGKPISTDNLKHTYLNQLINEGLVDYTESKIYPRQNIYYPLDTESLSITSIMSPIDKESQHSYQVYEKIAKNITEGWIFHEIIRLIRRRFGWGDKDSIDRIKDSDRLQLIEYIKDPAKFKIWDTIEEVLLKDEDRENEDKESRRRRRLRTDEFIKKYYNISSISIDNKPSTILTSFAKRSSLLSILSKIDSIDDKEDITTNIDKEGVEKSNYIIQEPSKSSLPSQQSSQQSSSSVESISCTYCSYHGKSESEILRHSVNAHKGMPARPDRSLKELIETNQNN